MTPKPIFIVALMLFSGALPPTGVWAAPTTEWTFHKTADGSHPSGREQAMVWLMNRAREQPAWEGRWLAVNNNSDVSSARISWGVDTNVLIDSLDSCTSSPPAAFDVRLYIAASNHCADLISRNAQDHLLQYERVHDAGFSNTYYRGNVFSYTRSSVHAHCGFNIDWGYDDIDWDGASLKPDWKTLGDGMQDSLGHRAAIMSTDYNYYSNVGVAMEDKGPTNTIGPIITTINYSGANTGYPNHYNRFLVGTVWDDINTNGLYDTGEGKSGITVMPNIGTFYAITANSGGWALPATAAGTYVITFSGAAIGPDVVVTAAVGSVSVRVPWPGTEKTEKNVPIYWHQSYGVFADYDNADMLDTDSDGMTNWQEYIAGTMPSDGNSVFEITETASTNGQPAISWPSQTGRLYTVLYSSVLNGGTWSNAPGGTALTGNGSTMSYTNCPDISPCFLRLTVSAP